MENHTNPRNRRAPGYPGGGPSFPEPFPNDYDTGFDPGEPPAWMREIPDAPGYDDPGRGWHRADDTGARTGNRTRNAPPPGGNGNGNGTANGKGDAWPEPSPLTAAYPPQPYPIEALPIPILAAVLEVQGFVKAPVPMVVTSALSACSLAIQGHYDVQRAEKLVGPSSLFTLILADSGERKSTCDGFFTKAIRDYQAHQAEAAKPLLKDHEARCQAWEAKHNGVKDKIRQLTKAGKSSEMEEAALHELERKKPREPRIPRLLYTDATPEALAHGLAKQWPSGGVVSSEAGTVFGSHGMGRDSVVRNLALLNQLWDGAQITIDRRTSESFVVKGARLSVSLQVQESVLQEFLSKSGGLARGSGFLARFLIAWPESTQGRRIFTEAPPHWPALEAFNQRLTQILATPNPVDDDGMLTPHLLAMTPAAKRLWVHFHDSIEKGLKRGREYHDVRDVASKSADNAVRLAALFHVFEDQPGDIGEFSFSRAGQIVTWHLSESRRFFDSLAVPEELGLAQRLDTWLLDTCRHEGETRIPTTKLQQFGPYVLRSRVAIDTAMKELDALNRARMVNDGKKKWIAVNPVLLAPIAE